MNIENRFYEAANESNNPDSGSRIMHLLAGLERQKEELGPIAVELIELLHRLGVGASVQSLPPQVKRKP